MTRRRLAVSRLGILWVLWIVWILLGPVTASLAAEVEEDYDDQGRLTRTVDEEGREVRLTYDAAGRAKVDLATRDDPADTGSTRDAGTSRGKVDTGR